LNYDLLRELTQEVGAANLKPLSRAESFQRHMNGGSANFLNFKLQEAKDKARLHEAFKKHNLEKE